MLQGQREKLCVHPNGLALQALALWVPLLPSLVRNTTVSLLKVSKRLLSQHAAMHISISSYFSVSILPSHLPAAFANAGGRAGWFPRPAGGRGQGEGAGPAHDDAEPGGTQWICLPDLPNLPTYPKLFFKILSEVYSKSYSMGKV